MIPAKAARFCTSTAPVDKIMESAGGDAEILRRVLDMGHESVLEHFSVTFGIAGVSRVTEVQLVRHRVASYSIKSGRYTKVAGRYEIAIPPSIKSHPDPRVKASYLSLMGQAQASYLEFMEEFGIHQEDARYMLPQATATQLMVTMNARELLHFFSKRLCAQAQWEIRDVARQMLSLCKELHPALFQGAGPECVRVGVCREMKSKSCGLRPHYTEVQQ
jgi:thymidylate synthase (FAD)